MRASYCADCTTVLLVLYYACAYVNDGAVSREPCRRAQAHTGIVGRRRCAKAHVCAHTRSLILPYGPCTFDSFASISIQVPATLRWHWLAWLQFLACAPINHICNDEHEFTHVVLLRLQSTAFQMQI
eukprot:491360-Pleurochrysis_carterae.AAC.6